MILILAWADGRKGLIRPKPSYYAWLDVLFVLHRLYNKSLVEEGVVLCERGTSLGNMLLSFFAKHYSQSSCTFEMLFFGCFSKNFSPNNSMGSMFPSICSLLHSSPNSPLEMLLSICTPNTSPQVIHGAQWGFPIISPHGPPHGTHQAHQSTKGILLHLQKALFHAIFQWD